ncbi:MAG TPA: transcriptional repressor [Clostridia bacterium]|nr:transcriptional repressor [Clostridia bacterium]
MKDLLNNSNMRWTSQRQTIYEEVQKTKGHFSAEEIYKKLLDQGGNIGLSTVYRTLQLLVDRKVLSQLPTDDDTALYECDDGSLHGHHHVHCISCGKTIELHIDKLDEIETHIKKTHDFEIIGHTVIFNGICPACRRKGIK